MAGQILEQFVPAVLLERGSDCLDAYGYARLLVSRVADSCNMAAFYRPFTLREAKTVLAEAWGQTGSLIHVFIPAQGARRLPRVKEQMFGNPSALTP